MKLLFINPHIHDFVYNPLSFKLVGRRPLLKYRYLDKIFKDYLYFWKESIDSSFPSKIYNKIPKKLFTLIVKFEKYIWIFLNKRKLRQLKDSDLKNSNLFIFGYKFSDNFFNYLIQVNFKNKIFIHLSHYHTYKIDPEYFGKLNIKLCFDNDITNNTFFKSRFFCYQDKLNILPFEIKTKFFKNQNRFNKITRVVATGTYHMYPRGVTGIDYLQYSTVHPIRLYIAMKDIKSKHFINFMSLYNPKKLLNLILGQRRYMAINIAEEYQKSSHSFVGCEGTGAIAIGTLESMASGCIPFISKNEIKGLLFDAKEADMITYSSEEDLYKKIVDFNSNLKHSFSYKNSEFAKLYLSDNLANLAKKVLEI